jgi:hypothetical protein
MQSEIKEVVRIYQTTEHLINFDNWSKNCNQHKLIDYLSEIKAIKTKDKSPTWGRYYLEIPMHVLEKFGIISNQPLVFYLNCIYGSNYFFAYSGEIFTGDAAWFDEYIELTQEMIINCGAFKRTEEILENKLNSEDFSSYLKQAKDKWKIVPIKNLELSIYADKMNSHIK